MKITHEIILDMRSLGQRQMIDVKQSDVLSREIVITLFDGGTAWSVPEDATILQVAYYKADRTGGRYDTLPDGSVACVANGNVITAQLHPQMFTVAGLVMCELCMLNEEGSQLTTFSWYMMVAESATNKITSEDYYNFASLIAMRKDVGSLKELQTETKLSLVAAINELVRNLKPEQMEVYWAAIEQISDGDICGVPYFDNLYTEDTGAYGILNVLRTDEEAVNPGIIEIPSAGYLAAAVKLASEEAKKDADSKQVLVVVNGVACTAEQLIQVAGENWRQEALSTRMDEPYLNEWGWKCCVEDGTTEMYEWLYRCLKESFDVEQRSIIVTDADGNETAYACTVDGGDDILKAVETAMDADLVDSYYATTADARILRLPVPQFALPNEDTLRHVLYRVVLDNPELCCPIYPSVKTVDGAEVLFLPIGYDDGCKYIYTVMPTAAKRSQMVARMRAAAEMVKDKIYYLYGIMPGDELTADQSKRVCKVIHDYIILHGNPSCSADGDRVPYWSHMGYAAFDSSLKANCSGYTQAFNYIARMYGITAIYMSGRAYLDINGDGDSADTGEFGGHAWVAVQLTGEAYSADPADWTCIDVYWDEPEHETSIGEVPAHDDVIWRYFMTSAEIYSEGYPTHEITIASGYGAYPMVGNPSGNYPYEGDNIYIWEDET